MFFSFFFSTFARLILLNMKIALVGYGKMGHVIERIAQERGHQVTARIDVNGGDDWGCDGLKEADCVIEFTRPDAALGNYDKVFAAGKPLVSGTTGWVAAMPEVKQRVQDEGLRFFWTSNFSIGVNLFFALNKKLAELMNPFDQYDVDMTEVHHTQKLDAPSGTAVTLAEGIIEGLDRKNGWQLGQVTFEGEVKEAAPELETDKVCIDAVREGQVPGTHIVHYNSPVDEITIEHKAKSREGFALGAVLAAEWLVKQPSGVYDMQDLMK